MNFLINKAINLSQEATKITQDIIDKSKEVGLSGFYYDTAEERINEIPDKLDSKFDRDKLDALKRLIAMMSKGQDVGKFMPNVVKNVSCPSFEVRKLVYVYLLRYAEQYPDIALLSINTFQKDLTDKNPMIRAMALRVLSSIKVREVVPIVVFGLKTCVRDMFPYVRKAAASSIPKCYELDPTQKEHLLEIIEFLLNDKSYVVLGSVIACFNQICPDRLDLIHKQYRKLCKLLADIDEWGQIQVVDLLERYVRTYFTEPKELVDPHLQLLFESSSLLLFSRNRAVVLRVVSLFINLAPMKQWVTFHDPLIRILLTSQKEQQLVILQNILSICQKCPDLFQESIKHFFVYYNDPPTICMIKVKILTLLLNSTNVEMLNKEFLCYVHMQIDDLVLQTIKSVSTLCDTYRSYCSIWLLELLPLVACEKDLIAGEAILVIRQLLTLTPDMNSKAVIRLVKSFEHISMPSAKSSVLWLIGQHCDSEPILRVAPDVFRLSLKHFSNEDEVIKLQTLNLGSKLMLALHKSSDKQDYDISLKLYQYALELARFDSNYDIRDKAPCSSI